MTTIAVKPESEWEAGTEGIFTLPEEKYRPSLGVNQTILKKMLRSPAHAKQEMIKPMKHTDAMMIGHLAHLACLEPKLFGRDVSHRIQPLTYESTGMQCPTCKTITDSAKCKECKTDRVPITIEKDWNFASKTCQKWRDDGPKLPIINSTDASNLDGMKHAVLAHSIAGRLMKNGVSELCAYANDPDSGMLLKAKIDKIVVDASKDWWIADLKKVQDAREFEKDCTVRRYDIQVAMNIDILALLGVQVRGFLFLVVEEEEPHGVMVRRASEKMINTGRETYRRALTEFAVCQETDTWECYPEVVQSIDLLPWVK